MMVNGVITGVLPPGVFPAAYYNPPTKNRMGDYSYGGRGGGGGRVAMGSGRGTMGGRSRGFNYPPGTFPAGGGGENSAEQQIAQQRADLQRRQQILQMNSHRALDSRGLPIFVMPGPHGGPGGQIGPGGQVEGPGGQGGGQMGGPGGHPMGGRMQATEIAQPAVLQPGKGQQFFVDPFRLYSKVRERQR